VISLLSNSSISEALSAVSAVSQQIDIATGTPWLSELGNMLRTVGTDRKVRVAFGNRYPETSISYLFRKYRQAISVQSAAEMVSFPPRKVVSQRHEQILENIKLNIAELDQSSDDEQTLKLLLNLIQSNVLLIRSCSKSAVYEDVFVGLKGNKSIGLIGAGSLLKPPDTTEGTSWIRSDQEDFVTQVHEKFREHWDTGTTINAEVASLLQNSWALVDVPPYLQYLNFMYQLIRTRLEITQSDGRLHEIDDSFPDLSDFQWIAVQQGLNILNQYNGVFIADVVGLGKTYIGAAMLKKLKLQGFTSVIVCPPTLKDMWEEFNQVYDLGAIVYSSGLLAKSEHSDFDQDKFQTRSRQVVLIDESHRFKNRDSNSYRNLSDYSSTRKTILLTATPYSLKPDDVLQQIRLFADDDLDVGLNPPRIGDYFDVINNGEGSLVDVLRQLLIRRTRNHIKKYYPSAMINGRTLTFPTRRPPVVVRYNLESAFGFENAYSTLIHMLGKPQRNQSADHSEDGGPASMTYARYGLHTYVLPQFRETFPYSELKQTSVSMRGFMRVLLFKRLESSLQAFRETLKAMLMTHEKFLGLLSMGRVATGKSAQRLLADTSMSDVQELFDALDEVDTRYDVDKFDIIKLKRDVQNDIDILEQLYMTVEHIPPSKDGKLNVLKGLLDRELMQNKVLIFTQYESTARYLFENLSGSDVEMLSGAKRSGRRSFMRTIARFAPRANSKFVHVGDTPIRVLVATDVLSEGMNLQDCSTIINYDLTYNPVRLIQRIGRIDRVGSEAEYISTYNFLPELEVESVLGIEDLLRRRIQDIHNFIGEDNAILTSDEQLNMDEMYVAYTSSPEDPSEDESGNAVDYTELEERIRYIQQEDPELFERVKNLPIGARSSRAAKSERDQGSVVFFASDSGYEKVQIYDKNGKLKSERVEDALSLLDCDVDESLKGFSGNHSRLVSSALSNFRDTVNERVTDQAHGPSLSVGQRYVLRIIDLQIRSQNDEQRLNLLDQLRSTFMRPVSSAVIDELNRLRRLAPSQSDVVARLETIVHEHGIKVQEDDFHQIQIPRSWIVCSESLV
jgi:superfamily II DNA/RNA helicase